MSTFVSEVHKRATEGGYDTRSIVRDCRTLNGLETKSCKPFEDQAKDYDRRVKDIPELEQKAAGLTKEVKDLEKNRAELLAKFNTDEKSLRDFEKTRSSLSACGLTLQDLDGDARVLQQLINDEALHLVRKLKQIGDLDEKLRSQRAELGQLRLDCEDEEKKRDSAKKELKQMDPELKEGRSIKAIGLHPSQFERLRNLVLSLSSVRDIPTAQSLELSLGRSERTMIYSWDSRLLSRGRRRRWLLSGAKSKKRGRSFERSKPAAEPQKRSWTRTTRSRRRGLLQK